MAKDDEELKKFVGMKITDIRNATDEEHANVYPPEEQPDGEDAEPLMVAILENNCKLYLLSDLATPENQKEDEDEMEIAVAELENGEIIEIPAE